MSEQCQLNYLQRGLNLFLHKSYDGWRLSGYNAGIIIDMYDLVIIDTLQMSYNRKKYIFSFMICYPCTFLKGEFVTELRWRRETRIKIRGEARQGMKDLSPKASGVKRKKNSSQRRRMSQRGGRER